MKLLYLSDCYAGASVFASQVHSLCDHQCDHLDVTLLAHYQCAPQVQVHRYALRLRAWVPNMSMPLIAAAVGIRYGLGGMLDGQDVVHCRGHVMSFVAIVARACSGSRARIVADIRGEAAAEAGGSGSMLGRLKYRLMRWMERVIFCHADHVCFVSEPMAKHFRDMYGVAPERYSVFPTLVDTRFFRKSPEQRAAKRAELGVRDGQLLYVYSGGISYWQNVDKIIARFAEVSTTGDRFVLLILTTAPNEVSAMIEALGAGQAPIIVRSARYDEVGAYLNAADAGLIIRDTSVVNRVASPTKVNEYYACGLPIIYALEGIGADDFSPWVRKVTTFQALEEVAAGHRGIYAHLCCEEGL